MKSKTWTPREFRLLLKDNGYYPMSRQSRGSHIAYYNSEKNDTIKVNSQVNKMVARKIIKLHELKVGW